MGARIKFDDGTSVKVGPLDNSGAPTIITFPPRVIKSLLFTVTDVSETTSITGAGLAELEVFKPNTASHVSGF